MRRRQACKTTCRQVTSPEADDPQEPGRTLRRYAVRHLERHSPSTPYPEVCQRVADLFGKPPGGWRIIDRSDALGGRPGPAGGAPWSSPLGGRVQGPLTVQTFGKTRSIP